jgi:hypothetical protein
MSPNIYVYLYLCLCLFTSLCVSHSLPLSTSLRHIFTSWICIHCLIRLAPSPAISGIWEALHRYGYIRHHLATVRRVRALTTSLIKTCLNPMKHRQTPMIPIKDTELIDSPNDRTTTVLLLSALSFKNSLMIIRCLYFNPLSYTLLNPIQ